MDADGHVVRTTSELTTGTEIVTRFADGMARSKVTAVDGPPPSQDNPPSGSTPPGGPTRGEDTP
jgi:hypothetical protein